MNRVLTHVLFWMVMLFWTSAIYDYSGKYGWHFVWFNIVRFPLIIAATYLVIYYFLPKWLIRSRSYFYFALAFVLNFVVVTLLDRVIIGSKLIDEILKGTGLTYRFFNEIPIIRNAFILLSIMVLALIIRFFKLYLAEEKRKHQLEEQQLSTELAFLKAQINPHFLFNALNNLYSIAVHKEQTEIAMGLEHLSSVMRYLTYESNAPKVGLEKEVQLLQDYIEIQHLRLSDTDDTTISFKLEGAIAGKMIAPVILLPLVENAFKHGIKPGKKCLVDIRLSIVDTQLLFVVKNTLFEQQIEPIREDGIGLKNVRKRLSLVYPEQYQLEATATQGFFLSSLVLQLN